MKPENLKGVVHSDPQILGGTPVFVGTRVPLQNLTKFDLAVIMLHPAAQAVGYRFAHAAGHRSIGNCEAQGRAEDSFANCLLATEFHLHWFGVL